MYNLHILNKHRHIECYSNTITHSPVATGGSGGLNPFKQSSKPPQIEI